MAGTHPDLLRVARPEDKHELPIRVIRDLCIDLGLKPMSGRRKLAIIDDADDLNDEAANAFLKTLEEPPEGSVLILIATSAEGQLDTILSRCRVVRFDPLPESELAAVLVEQGWWIPPRPPVGWPSWPRGAYPGPGGWPTPPWPSSGGPSSTRWVPPGVRRPGPGPPDRGVRQSGGQGERGQAGPGPAGPRRAIAPLPGLGLAGRRPRTPHHRPRGGRAVANLAGRIGPEAILGLADRCLEADYHVRRNLYLPLVLDDLAHDLGALINSKDRG